LLREQRSSEYRGKKKAKNHPYSVARPF
jgi:hypothetical protein